MILALMDPPVKPSWLAFLAIDGKVDFADTAKKIPKIVRFGTERRLSGT